MRNIWFLFSTTKVHVDVRTPEVTLECPLVTNRTAKGIYTWDKSMAGLIVSQPCQKGEGSMATHKCGVDGRWKSMNISSCSFIKDITRKLSKLAKVQKIISAFLSFYISDKCKCCIMMLESA